MWSRELDGEVVKGETWLVLLIVIKLKNKKFMENNAFYHRLIKQQVDD